MELPGDERIRPLHASRRAETLPVRFVSGPPAKPSISVKPSPGTWGWPEPRPSRGSHYQTSRQQPYHKNSGRRNSGEDDAEFYRKSHWQRKHPRDWVVNDSDSQLGTEELPARPSRHRDDDSTSSDEREFSHRSRRARHTSQTRPPERYTYDSPSDGETDLNLDLKSSAYSFEFSRHKRRSLSQGSPSESLSKPLEEETVASEPQARFSGAKWGSVQVVRSQYTGDGSIGGLHSVKLTTIHDATQGSRKGMMPIFRWMYVRFLYNTVGRGIDSFQATLKISTWILTSFRCVLNRLILSLFKSVSNNSLSMELLILPD